MKLVRVREQARSASGTPSARFALVVDDKVHRLPEHWGFADAVRALHTGRLEDAEPSASALDEWELLAPVPTPASMRDCVGFLQHIRNTRRSRGDLAPLGEVWQQRPGFYFSNPNSVHSATAAVTIPPGCQEFDFELEIAAVLGGGGRDLTAEEAEQLIAGYVLFCDWSARDFQAEERAMQIGLGKAKDAAISLGPWILSADEAAAFRRPDGLDIPVSASVNGERVTAPGTRYVGMDWSYGEIVAFASIGADLVAGDVVAAGTVPTGCLLEHSATEGFRGWLADGDVVRLDAGPLGEIVSPVVASPTRAQWRQA
jgi:2-keto-4-pentenoate hydratase/2-oxohepta-3-ene-1,7-dioic acid hydratase in catechol pathway